MININYRAYLSCVIICLIVNLLAGLVTQSSVSDWYHTIHRPSFTPPNSVFPVVWTILYVMMGIAWGYINTIKKFSKISSKQNVYFIFQLILNCSWSFIFFGAHAIGFALVNLVILWVFLIITIHYFFKVSKISGWLLVPYFFWTSYAFILNYTIWRLN